MNEQDEIHKLRYLIIDLKSQLNIAKYTLEGIVNEGGIEYSRECHVLCAQSALKYITVMGEFKC